MLKHITKQTHILSIFAFIIIISCILTTLPIHATSYTLQYNTVQNAYGNWVTSGGNYNGNELTYDCYAYALHRYDAGTILNPMDYQPGLISGEGSIADCTNIYELAGLVSSDLHALGYTDISLSYSIPTVTSSQELICVRMNDPDDGDYTYHFMRYDLETDAWYHKPGTSAVLKFNSVPSSSVPWYEEVSHDGIEALTGVVYEGPIAYFRYTKNQINVPQSNSIRLNIQPGHDVFCEINVNTPGAYDISLSSSYGFDFILYDEEFASEAGNIALDFANYKLPMVYMSGKYYLVIQFTSPTVSHYVDIQIAAHTHSYSSYEYKDYRTHIKHCDCGNIQTQGHYVDRDSIINNRYANCLGCGALLDLNNDIAQLLSLPEVKYSINGSYLLSSGIAVLVDEDIEAYQNGTLIFYEKGKTPVTQ